MEGSRFFVHHDLLGSAVAVTDDPASPANTKVVERLTYSAYGGVQAWHNPNWNTSTGYGTPSALSRVGLPFLYTGQRYEPVTGLHYYKNRPYDPATGRFLRRDLIGYADGPLIYEYARSNPSMVVDPLGLGWQDLDGNMMSSTDQAIFNSVTVQIRSGEAWQHYKDTNDESGFAIFKESPASGALATPLVKEANDIVANPAPDQGSNPPTIGGKPYLGDVHVHMTGDASQLLYEAGPPDLNPEDAYGNPVPRVAPRYGITSEGIWKLDVGKNRSEWILRKSAFREWLKESMAWYRMSSSAIDSGIEEHVSVVRSSATDFKNWDSTLDALTEQSRKWGPNLPSIHFDVADAVATAASRLFMSGEISYWTSGRSSELYGMQGQRVHGAEMTVLGPGGVMSIEGGGFSGMGNNTLPPCNGAACKALGKAPPEI